MEDRRSSSAKRAQCTRTVGAYSSKPRRTQRELPQDDVPFRVPCSQGQPHLTSFRPQHKLPCRGSHTLVLFAQRDFRVLDLARHAGSASYLKSSVKPALQRWSQFRCWSLKSGFSPSSLAVPRSMSAKVEDASLIMIGFTLVPLVNPVSP